MYISGGTVTVTGSNIYSNEARSVGACLLNPRGTFFRRPRRKKLPRSDLIFLVWQGAGVYIAKGTVSFDSCNIHDNTARSVRAFRTSHVLSSYAPALLQSSF